MFMGFILHIYVIFRTNLLSGGPAHNAVFLPILVFRRNKIWEHDFWNKRDPEDLEWTSRNHRGVHEARGAPTPWARPPPSWAPRGSTDLLLPPIYTYVPPKTSRSTTKT